MVARCRRRAVRRNDNGLDIHELADAETRKLATVAAVLHATERQLGIGGNRGVDEHRTRFDVIGCNALAPGEIAGEHTTAEPEFGIVGDAHRILYVPRGTHGRYRPEQ